MVAVCFLVRTDICRSRAPPAVIDARLDRHRLQWAEPDRDLWCEQALVLAEVVRPHARPARYRRMVVHPLDAGEQAVREH